MEDSMSAVAWGSAGVWDPGYDGGPARVRPSTPRRPQLLVLPGGGEGGAAPVGAVRITRRGRLALLSLAVALAAVLGAVGLRGAGATEPLPTVTVGAGQTLSELAARELPQMSISDGILAIQLANDLSTAQVRAGQELLIPRG
jgi:hypothetical protein